MIPAPFTYQRAGSVDEALSLAAEGGDDAKFLAGGHSLLPLMKLRLAVPEVLIDIGRLSELSYVREENGHIAVAEVDTETGKVTLVRHVTVDDAGIVVNPVLTEGQRHGGIAQGAAQALLEEMVYDADGNPLTGTLADYAAITATELPSFELLVSETPTPINPLGVKGIGEAGTIGATPAVQNAVIDAVSHLGVRHIDMPTTPGRVWAAIKEARNSQ